VNRASGQLTAVIVGFILTMVGLAMIVTVVMLPVGSVLMLVGVLIVVSGIFAPRAIAPNCRAIDDRERAAASGSARAARRDKLEDVVYVDDLDIPIGKLTESAQRVIERAADETRRREHP